jgi:hypothetical protein
MSVDNNPRNNPINNPRNNPRNRIKEHFNNNFGHCSVNANTKSLRKNGRFVKPWGILQTD